MGTLEGFLHPEEMGPVRVPLSPRFRDEQGNPIQWELRPVSARENEALIRRHTRQDTQGNWRLDRAAYRMAFAACGVGCPDLEDAQLQQRYHALGREDLLGRMLLAGEFAALYEKVSRISGFGHSLEDEVDEAKKESGTVSGNSPAPTMPFSGITCCPDSSQP
ncbi:MAG: phage tail assembly chaperone [Eubacteriales bacterium]|jgi:hypothetical protein